MNDEFKMFHKHRIISIILDQQTPYNDYSNGLSDSGTYKCKNNKEKLQAIITSLNNIDWITFEEREELLSVLGISE